MEHEQKNTDTAHACALTACAMGSYTKRGNIHKIAVVGGALALAQNDGFSFS